MKTIFYYGRIYIFRGPWYNKTKRNLRCLMLLEAVAEHSFSAHSAALGRRRFVLPAWIWSSMDTCKRSHATVTMGAAHPTCIPCSKAAEKRSPPPREGCAYLLNPGEVHDGPPRRTHSIGDLTQRKKQASLPELL